MTTTSPAPTRSHLLSPVAISERADIGSPWEPVEITHISPGGTESTCSISIRLPLGIEMMPKRVPNSTFLPMERPNVATLRPLATAASMICCTRCMWLAKQATMIRFPGWAAMTRRRRDADGRLRLGEAGLLRVGGIRQEEADTIGAGQLPHPREVGPAAVDRLQVELEIARVEDDPLRGVEGDGERIGHRVGDRE